MEEERKKARGEAKWGLVWGAAPAVAARAVGVKGATQPARSLEEPGRGLVGRRAAELGVDRTV